MTKPEVKEVEQKVEKPTVDSIRTLKDTYETYYSTLRTQQNKDQEYYDDTFATHIKEPYHTVRTASAAKLVDSIIENINTDNPQARQEPRNKTKVEVERSSKITRLLNYWLKLLVDEIEEALKNSNLRGEAFFQVEYNNAWDKDDFTSLPVRITAPDPLTIWPDPVEIDGIPRRVIKFQEMKVSDVILSFPNWENPRNKKLDDVVDYLAYWNSKWRYFEADKIALLPGGVQPNVLKMPPLIHCYSGYGKRSHESKPEQRVVGRLRKLRSRLEEECEVESRIDSIIGLYANPVLKIKRISEGVGEIDENKIKFSPGAVLDVPYGFELEIVQGEVPSPNMYHHLNQVRAAVGAETPPILQGRASGPRTSGRLEDILGEHAKTKHGRLVRNVEKALAKALGMGMKMLVESSVLPITIRLESIENEKTVRKDEKITKDDIDGYFNCTVELKAPDELAQDRKAMLYRLLANENRIDWKTLLVEGLGWTPDKAEDVIDQTIADSFILSDPTIKGIIVREAIEKLGMTRYLKEIEADVKRQKEIQEGLKETNQFGGGQVRGTEARNQTASEIVRQVLEETPVGIRKGEGM